uniref:Uncharacterized protein n=1 Tax=Haptolina brevifila TaxID=156173 RepID=A0A7S2DJI9_9EUKA|mmetsp:Transcript_39705/g.79360  ORF Transcript_39705/g.79360 Transcript_39705/m.79360 type:complete len:185 (+) Transcript_39705:436-990(+)
MPLLPSPLRVSPFFAAVLFDRYVTDANHLHRCRHARHSELPALRRFLLTDGLLELKRRTRDHYEAYRRAALSPGLLTRMRRAIFRLALLSPMLLAGVPIAVRETLSHKLYAVLPPVPKVYVTWQRLGAAAPAAKLIAHSTVRPLHRVPPQPIVTSFGPLVSSPPPLLSFLAQAAGLSTLVATAF